LKSFSPRCCRHGERNQKLTTATDLAAAKQAPGELRTLFFSVIARVEQLEREVASLKTVTATLMEAMSTLELRRFIERAWFEVIEQLRIEHEELGNRLTRKVTKQDGARRVPVRLSEWLTSGGAVCTRSCSKRTTSPNANGSYVSYRNTKQVVELNLVITYSRFFVYSESHIFQPAECRHSHSR
jgi:hypothetical protein